MFHLKVVNKLLHHCHSTVTVDTIRNREITQLKDNTDKQKEESPMLKTEIVDDDKRALSEKKPISIPQEVKAPDSSLSQQDKQFYTYNISVNVKVIYFTHILQL